MVSVKYDGRLGNNMIQYFVSKLFSMKKNLFFAGTPSFYQYEWSNICSKYDNPKNIGTTIIKVDDENFIDIFNSNSSDKCHYIFDGWFQNKFFFSTYENDIKNLIDITYSKKEEDELFVHYRIGDINNDRKMLPIEYYQEYLSNIKFNKGYISSDTISHPNCVKLIKDFNLVPVSDLSPIETILFGKDFKKIILSEGTFSWWIGFLSKKSDIFCNKRDRFWHGDLFFDRWNYICWDYPERSIYNGTKLKNTEAIRLC